MVKMTVKIEGMMCPMCEAHMNDGIKKVINVKKVTCSHKLGETVIVAESIDEATVRAVAEKNGYTVTDIRTESVREKGFFASLFSK